MKYKKKYACPVNQLITSNKFSPNCLQCCALSFIETMSAESVNMDPEEFDAYFSGRAQPPGSWKSSLLMCEGLQVNH